MKYLLELLYSYKQRKALDAFGKALIRLKEDREVADDALAQYIELTGNGGDI